MFLSRTLPVWIASLLASGCVDHAAETELQEGGRSSRSRPASRQQSARAKSPAAGGVHQPFDPAKGELPDPKALSALLGRLVQDGKVDYALAAEERGVIDQYLAGVAAADLTDATKAEKLAFYINAYNAKVLVMVLKYVRGKGEGGKDLEGVLAVEGASGVKFFDVKEIIVGGQLMSLNELEQLGRSLGDSRIHFAVNCASISCPPLLGRAWRPETLDADLDAATEAYLRSDLGLQVKDRRVYVSKIFEWYEADWGGRGGVTNFLMRYAPRAAKEHLDREVGYLDYDWRLNRL